MTLTDDYRSITLTIGAATAVSGDFYLFSFNGDSFSLPIQGGLWSETECKAAFESLDTISNVDCTRATVDAGTVNGVPTTDYTIVFRKFPTLMRSSSSINLYDSSNDGTVPFSALACDTGPVDSSQDPVCVLTDVPMTKTTLPEYLICSGRGICDVGTGLCNCFKNFANSNCDSYSEDYFSYQALLEEDVLQINNDEENFSGDILNIGFTQEGTYTSNAIIARDVDSDIFKIDGYGNLNMFQGGLTLTSGSSTVATNGMWIDGGVTIADGGLFLDDISGMTVFDVGMRIRGGGVSAQSHITVNDGGVFVADGGASIYDWGISVADGALVAAGGVSVHQGGVAVMGGDVDVAAGGLMIGDWRGGLTIYNAGLVINSGGLKTAGTRSDFYAPDGLTIYSSGLQVTGGLVINNDGLLNYGGLSIVNGGFELGQGATLLEGAGLTATGGATVFVGGVTVTGGVTINSNTALVKGGVRVTGGLTVNNVGVFIDTGDITLNNIGFNVEVGDVIVEETVFINNGKVEVAFGGLQVTGGIRVTHSGPSMHISGGISVNDAGIQLDAGGMKVFSLGVTVEDGETAVDVLQVTNGVSIYTGGLDVTAGGITVEASGMRVSGGLTLPDVGLHVTGGISVQAGGLTVENTGLTVRSSGLKITSGGLDVDLGGLQIDTAGMYVNSGGVAASTFSEVIVGGLQVTGGVTVQTSDLSIADGLRIQVNGLFVADALETENNLKVTGGLAVHTGGALVTGGLTVMNMGINVNGGITIDDNSGAGDLVLLGTGAKLYTTDLRAPSLHVHGNLRVTGGITVSNPNGEVWITGGLSVRALGLAVDAGDIQTDYLYARRGITITSNGLAVTDGMTILDTGFYIVDGLDLVDTGELQVTGGISVENTGLVVDGGMSVHQLGFRIAQGGIDVLNAGGLTVTNANLIVRSGGLSSTAQIATDTSVRIVAGGITVDGGFYTSGGVTVRANNMDVSGSTPSLLHLGGLFVTGGVTVNNVGMYISGGMTVVNSGMVLHSPAGGTAHQIIGIKNNVKRRSSVGSFGVEVFDDQGNNDDVYNYDELVSEFGEEPMPSDYRLKTDVAILTNAMERIKAIRGVSYTWKQDGATKPIQGGDTRKRHIGVIAQELRAVLPEATNFLPKGFLEYSGSVNLTGVTAIEESQPTSLSEDFKNSYDTNHVTAKVESETGAVAKTKAQRVGATSYNSSIEEDTHLLGVHYSDIIPLLIEAIKEIQSRVDSPIQYVSSEIQQRHEANQELMKREQQQTFSSSEVQDIWAALGDNLLGSSASNQYASRKELNWGGIDTCPCLAEISYEQIHEVTDRLERAQRQESILLRLLELVQFYSV